MSNRLFHTYIFMLMLLLSATSAWASTNCTGYKEGYPEHYCDCKQAKQLVMLPLDIMVTDSIWYKGKAELFLNGFTSYLYSDCDVNFDIYQNCTKSTSRLYSVTIPKNQARDVTAETIKQKLEEANMSAPSIVLYICIYPVDGTGGRLMCYPYNHRGCG